MNSSLCDICANPLKWFAFGQCDHSLCHICCLRLRALYKTLACPLCKTECPTVVFAKSAERAFSTFHLPSLKRDKKLGIYFEEPAMFNETMGLLLFNCPEPNCSVVCSGGWQDLRNHIKKTHNGLLLCDLCVSFKKVFVHESTLYTSETLKIHNKSGDKDDPSFRGHPDCGFCSIRFYDSDALYEHCRQKHEKCFLCERQGIRDQYFVHYSSLENHFHSEHFPCLEAECLEQKFVVFASDMDLQGHFLEKHADSKTKARGRQINIDITIAGGPSGGRRGGKGRKATQIVDDSGDSPQNTSLDRMPATRMSPAGSPSSSRRFRVPDGFGSQLTPVSVPSSQTGAFSSYAPRPQVGGSTSLPSSLNNSSTFPLPQDSVINQVEELLLTPAQNDIFISGGPELVVAIQKIIGLQVLSMSRLKIAFWSFKNGQLAAEKLLAEFAAMAESQHPRKKPDQLLGEMSSLWHRLADTLPEEATDSQLQKALEKKSKKKGLTIEEFEALRNGEPKRSAMLRVWNDRKVKIKQATSEIMPRKQNSWAAIDPTPSQSSASSSSKPRSNTAAPSVARVLVIKEKGSIIPKSSKKGKQRAESLASSSLSLSSLSVQENAISDPPPPIPVSVAAAASQALSGGPSISRSKAEFPALPAPPPKANSRTYANKSNAWGSGVQDSSSTTVNADIEGQGPKKGKKNKGQVLMRFG